MLLLLCLTLVLSHCPLASVFLNLFKKKADHVTPRLKPSNGQQLLPFIQTKIITVAHKTSLILLCDFPDFKSYFFPFHLPISQYLRLQYISHCDRNIMPLSLPSIRNILPGTTSLGYNPSMGYITLPWDYILLSPSLPSSLYSHVTFSTTPFPQKKGFNMCLKVQKHAWYMLCSQINTCEINK